MVRTFITTITLLSGVLYPSSLFMILFGQQKESLAQEVFTRGNEIFLKQDSSSMVQLTRDGKPKYNVLLSPGKKWVVYNGDSTWSEEAPAASQFVFTVINLKDFSKKEIGFSTSRDSKIEKVEWLGPDRFGVIAPFLSAYDYAIFDAVQGKKIDYALCRAPSLSPNRSNLAYLYVIPRGFPEELTSDYINIVDVTQDEDRIRQRINQSRAVYPERDINERFTDLADRHFVKSDLVWSSDSRSLAFIEHHQQAFWGVVLDFESLEVIKPSGIRRFKLGSETELRLRQIEDFNWEGKETLIITGTKGIWDPVNQIERVGPKMQWRIDLRTGTISGREIK